ncbi:MAG: hypothetical protein ACPLX8_00135 [Nanopusillaceae archaeon]
MKDIYKVSKILSEYLVYRYKIVYISKTINKIKYYDIFAEYCLITFPFVISTYNIMKNQSIIEILQKMRDKYINQIVDNGLLCDITRLMINKSYDIIVGYINDDKIDSIYDYYYYLSSYMSMVYESTYVENDKVIISEDIRNGKSLEELEKVLIDYLSSNFKQVDIYLISGNTTIDVEQYDNVKVESISLNEYNERLSKLYGVDLWV